MEKQTRDQTALLNKLDELLSEEEISAIQATLDSAHPAEIAHSLESLPHDQRIIVWDLIADSELSGDVLTFVNDEVRAGLIKQTTAKDLIAATGSLPTDDLADILPDLPDHVINELLLAMDNQDRQRLESILQYPDDTAGGLMSIDSVTVRPDVTLDVIKRYLRFRGELPDTTDKLFVINREDKLLGALPLGILLTHDDDLTVAEVFKPDVEYLNANTNANEIAHLFERRDLISAPVVDDNHTLLGRITIDDIVDVIRDAADHSFLSQAGLDEEDDLFSPVLRSTRRRSIWLGINLLTAILASWVIGLFSGTIEQLVALAVLMPIVASMGGIAGSQTLTIVIRGIALGHIGKSNARELLSKELLIGLSNGLFWSCIIGVFAYLWFQNISLGIILSFAIFFNLIIAALAGATIPLLLRRFGADPALAGSVVLTTITDVFGFATFLGLAALFIL